MVEPPYPLGHTPSMVFSQPPVEAALRRHVERACRASRWRWAWRLRRRQDGDGALTVRLEDGDGKPASVRAKLRDRLRRRLQRGARGGSAMVLEDLCFDEPWLVVDVQVNERGLAKLPKTSVQYCEPARPCTYVIGPGNHRRWEISLLPGEDPAAMATRRAPGACCGAGSRRKTRPVAPGQLPLPCAGGARMARRPRVHRRRRGAPAAAFPGPGHVPGRARRRQPGVEAARGAGAAKSPVRPPRRCSIAMPASEGARARAHHRIKEIGAVICERDPAAASARDAALIEAAGGAIRTVPRQDIIPPLACGLLAAGGSATGTLFPQPRVNGPAGPALLDQMAGAGWRIVTTLDTAQLPPALLGLAARLGTLVDIVPDAGEFSSAPQRMRTAELDGVLARWFERHGCCAAVVRPDHYVYGVAGSAAALHELLAALADTLERSTTFRQETE
jgi:3-(3-hydroxy-phenyl)propionate hydroxylase